MIELKDGQQQETEDKLSFHLALLSQLLSLVSIVIAWHLLAVPAIPLLLLLASRLSGLEVKILYYCPLQSIQ